MTLRPAGWKPAIQQVGNLRYVPSRAKPASGAFLVETFDQFHALYETSNAWLEELRGERTLFDLDRQILQHNLYGVDLNAEAMLYTSGAPFTTWPPPRITRMC